MDAVKVTVNHRDYILKDGQTGTIRCAGQEMTTDFKITFITAGSFTFNGFTTSSKGGASTGLACAGCEMPTDIVIRGGVEENTMVVDSPKPIEVSTVEALDDLLGSATDADVGGVYKYTGESTDWYVNGKVHRYEKNTLYIISKEY